MLSAIIDTNVVVTGISTGNPHSATAAVIDRLFAGEFIHFASLESLIEIHDVLRLPDIRAIHKLTDQKLDDLLASLESKSTVLASADIVSAAIPRDVTDAKWLALAMQSGADFLVTNDRRHLLRLRRFGRTQIVTPVVFLRVLKQATDQ